LNDDSALVEKNIRSSGRGRWIFWLRVAAGAAVVGYLMQHTQWKPVEAAIQGLAWQHWAAALGIFLCAQVASAWRWAELSRPLGFHYSRLRFIQLYFEGMFFNLCLPSSIGGDVLKAYWLAPNTAGRMLGACTVLADRAAGLIGLGVIGATALAARTFSWSLVPAALVGVALLAAALLAVSLGLRLWKWLAGLLPANGRLAGLAAKLMPYHDRPEVMRRSIGWGLAVQGLNVLMVAEIGHAIGLAIPLAVYCVAVPAVSLLTMLPLSISGVGLREGGLAWMLASYGVSEELGVTLGLLWFLVAIAGGMIGGCIYLLNFQRPYETTPTDVRQSPGTEEKNPAEDHRRAA
jgi:hypothetical protein